MVKTCNRCGLEKPLTEFYRSSNSKDGVMNPCKQCRNETRNKEKENERTRQWRRDNSEEFRAYRRRHYAENKEYYQLKRLSETLEITREEAQGWLDKQIDGCCLCRTTEKLHLDHDHETGKIRGWLCQPHNMAIGLFKDDYALLRLAADYLDPEILW